MLDLHDLYSRYAADVRRFALYLTGDRALADDITSQTFLRAWSSVGRIREATVKAYLFTIVRNLYLLEIRRSSRHVELPDALPSQVTEPERHLDHQAAVATVFRALHTLPEVDRAALLMRAQNDMPYRGHRTSAAAFAVEREGQDSSGKAEALRIAAKGCTAMNISPDVISDLLPLYLAGEASAGTHALLEEYLREHPAFAKEVRDQVERSTALLTAPTVNAAPDFGTRENDARTGATVQPLSELRARTFTRTHDASVFVCLRRGWRQLDNAQGQSATGGVPLGRRACVLVALLRHGAPSADAGALTRHTARCLGLAAIRSEIPTPAPLPCCERASRYRMLEATS